MPDRQYIVLVAEDAADLHALARTRRYTVLLNTVREFDKLELDDDHSFGDLPALEIAKRGVVALAYR